MQNRRQADILRITRERGSVSIRELTSVLGVSDETIRRNLKPLVATGLLQKVHGAVVVPDRPEEPPFQRRMHSHKQAKQRIASEVARRVRDGDSLILDGGTSNVCVALALRDHSGLLVVTNSAEIACLLGTRNGNRVFLAGGELRADDAAAFGEATLAFLRQFHVRFAVLSVSAISPQGEAMYFQLCDADYARTASAQAEQVVLIADHSKLGHQAVVRAFGPQDVGLLVTDEPPPDRLLRHLSAASVEVVVAPANVPAEQAIGG
ncbi:MAG: DeoR/GlpR transcriptional regulator [Proteobacteria bacterium]|nr:DeoR/GlpR transcriptional regulator [Pseudomonadota bacterium]